VNPDQRRASFCRKIAQFQDDRFFGFGLSNALEAGNTKFSKTSGKVGFRYFTEFEIRQEVE
jgi:hypothetical protein